MRLSVFIVLHLLFIGFHSNRLLAQENGLIVKLHEGVTEIQLPGLTGTLSVFGPDAFAVATGPVSGGEGVVIAAGTLGKGRVICAGHPGFLNPETSKKGETGRLFSNLLTWTVPEKSKSRTPVRLVLLENKSLADALGSAGFSALDVNSSQLRGALSKGDVLLARPSKFKQGDVADVIKFVRSGGGLILADAGWIWSGYEAKPGETLVEDFQGNQIAQLAGISFTSVNVSGQDLMVPVKTPDPAFSAPAALRKLVAQVQGAGTPEDRDVPAKTLELAISSIPSTDTLLLPEIQKVVAENPAANLFPKAGAAVKQSQILARLNVAIETRKAIAATPDAPLACPMAVEFPGSPSDGATAVTKKLSIDPNTPRWHSTGLYAKAGDVIDVSFPAFAVNQNLKVRIGCHTDQLWHLKEWKRAPQIAVSVPVTTQTLKVTSAFGGLIYIDVPDKNRLKPFEITIRGGIPAPRFVMGETTEEEWKTQRTLPGPWAEIGSEKLIITIPSESIRQYDDPAALMTFWDQVLDACADLATIPVERASPERIVTDVQISAGYLHAGYPIMGPTSTIKELLDVQTLRSKGNWGYYHELGHNHQKPEWTWDGLGEVTVNLFTMYALDTLNPGASHHSEVQIERQKKMVVEFEKTGQLDGPFPMLIPYTQLRMEFGWEPFKKVFAEYRALPENERPKTLQEKKDQWLIRFSRAANRNLGPFYEYWKLGNSEEARQAVSNLPAWDPPRLTR